MSKKLVLPAHSRKWHLEKLGVAKGDCVLCRRARKRRKSINVTLALILNEYKKGAS